MGSFYHDPGIGAVHPDSGTDGAIEEEPPREAVLVLILFQRMPPGFSHQREDE